MRTTVRAWIGIAALSVLPHVSAAQIVDRADFPFEVSADNIEYESAREVYVARGSVVIDKGERKLSADWVSFSNVTGRGVASGNVVVVDGGDTLHAKFVEFDVETLQGVVFDGRFDDRQSRFRMEGDEIVKTGPHTYTFKDGMFTTCRCPAGETDPWQIRAESAELEVQGYGTARNSTIEILGVPVVWLPWMIYPVKVERETGVLFPEVGYSSRNGAEVGLPLFIAARDNVNVTVTPRYLSKRGVKPDFKVEYVLGEESEGETFGSFLSDQHVNPHSAKEPFSRWRWGVLGKHDLFLPGDVRAKTRFAVISDNQYQIDFQEMRDHRADRYLESTGFAGRDFGASGEMGVVAGIDYADDLMNPTNLDRDDYVLQRLPYVEAEFLPAPVSETPLRELVSDDSILSRLVPAMDVDYVYFASWKNAKNWDDPMGADFPASGNGRYLDIGFDGNPDAREVNGKGVTTANGSNDNFTGNFGPEGDGRFQEGEPLADNGSRFSFHPSVALPFRTNWVEVYPEIGWHETLYATDAQSFASRGVFTGRIDLRTRLRRVFGDGIVHLLEPALSFTSVVPVGQSGNPVFTPETQRPQDRIRQLTLENRIRDSADRIEEFNGFTLTFANRLYAPPVPGEAARLLADFSFSGEVNASGGRFGRLIVDGRAYPFESLTSRFHVSFDPQDAVMRELYTALDWVSDAGHRVSVAYRYVHDIPNFFENWQFLDRLDKYQSGFNHVNQIEGALRLALGERWTATYAVAFSFEDTFLLGNRAGIEYLSKCGCWAAGVEGRQDRNGGFGARVIYRIIGLGDDRSSAMAGSLGFP